LIGAITIVAGSVDNSRLSLLKSRDDGLRMNDESVRKRRE